MKNLILILEDDPSRIEVMKSWLQDRLYMFEHYFFDQPSDLIELVKQRSDDVLAVSLDHDLNEICLSARHLPGDRTDDPTGMDVVAFLEQQPPQFPVLIHSSNHRAAEKMVRCFKKRHWSVDRVIPFDDTAWIGDEWLPKLRKMIEKHYAQLAEPCVNE